MPQNVQTELIVKLYSMSVQVNGATAAGQLPVHMF